MVRFEFKSHVNSNRMELAGKRKEEKERKEKGSPTQPKPEFTWDLNPNLTIQQTKEMHKHECTTMLFLR
jgi:hypothetical protein